MPSLFQRFSKNIKSLFQTEKKLTRPSDQEIIPKELDYTSGIEGWREKPDQLLEDKGFDLDEYDKMLRDDRIKFTHDFSKRQTLSVNADIVPASDEEEDVEKAEFVSRMVTVYLTDPPSVRVLGSADFEMEKELSAAGKSVFPTGGASP